jgi:hypothetical protein
LVIVERFGHSVLTIHTARSTLAHAAFDLIQVHPKEVAATAR